MVDNRVAVAKLGQECSINDILVMAAKRLGLSLQGASLDAQVVLHSQHSFDQLHPVVIQLLFNFLDLLRLVPEFLKLVLLLCIVLDNQLVQVLNFFMKVLVNILQFGLGHLQDGLPLSVEDLHFLLAEVEFFTCLINFLL